MPALLIRAPTKADHDAWLDLWHAYLTFYETSIPPDVTATTWARLLDPNEPIHGALATVDARPVGLAHWLTHRATWSITDYAYLEDLYVAPEARGQGVATALIDHAAGHARAQGAPHLYWLTHETNATARRLYDRIAARSGFIHYVRRLA